MRSTIVTGALLAALALTLAACGGGGKPAGDEATLTALVLSWYRDADPAVCERTT